MLTSIRRKPYYKYLLWSGAGLCFILLVGIGSGLVTNQKWLMGDDYVEYWAAGQLNLNGLNPYNPDQLLPLQLGTGKTVGVPVMMWNPPWLLTIAMPFGLLNYSVSRTLWLLFCVLIIFFSVNSLWSLYGGKSQYRYAAWIIGFTFIPVLEAIKTGQAGPLTLLGATGYLIYINRNKDFLAGIFISFLIVKPHLLYLFGLAVLVWSISEKRWLILLGIFTSTFVGTFLAWMINPLVINQYINAILNYPPLDWATPTMGGILRYLFGHNLRWLQFIPPIIGTIWFIYHWLKNKQSWNWLNQASLLIFVSVFTAAFGWSSDQIVLLVGILQIAVLVFSLPWNRYTVMVTSVYIMIDLLILMTRGNALLMWWLAPTLFIWYLWASKLLKQPNYSEFRQTNS